MPPNREDMARHYFLDVLGFMEVDKPFPLSERGGCWFELDSVVIHMGVEKEFIAQKKAHPGFTSENIDELARRLGENEFPVVWDETLPNVRRFYTNDPFGNRLEFIAAGCGFSESRL